jgi:hypothetical protein
MKCGNILNFNAMGHKAHYCMKEVGIFHLNSEHNHPGEQHVCLCGIKWTMDPITANEGRTWSREIDITPRHKTSMSTETDNQNDKESETDKPN